MEPLRPPDDASLAAQMRALFDARTRAHKALDVAISTRNRTAANAARQELDAAAAAISDLLHSRERRSVIEPQNIPPLPLSLS